MKRLGGARSAKSKPRCRLATIPLSASGPKPASHTVEYAGGTKCPSLGGLWFGGFRERHGRKPPFARCQSRSVVTRN